MDRAKISTKSFFQRPHISKPESFISCQSILTYSFKIRANDFYLDMNAKNINTNIDQLIPKYKMTQWVESVLNFLFCYFSVDFKKQNKLVK